MASIAARPAHLYYSFGTNPNRIVIAQLNEEWDQLAQQHAAWLTPPLSLSEVLGSIRSQPDQVLASLIHACQIGHPVAGRVIVQALLPKLILFSRVFPYPGVDSLTSALWIRITRYPLHRRPTSVAANLVLDAKKDVLTEVRVRPYPDPEPPDTSMTAETVIATARALNLATDQSLSIIESVYVDGLPSHDVAELHSMTSAAVRRRCSDTIRKLRQHRELLHDLLET
jgi:hypothetical protein